MKLKSKPKKCKICHNEFAQRNSLQACCSAGCAILYAKSKQGKGVLVKLDKETFKNMKIEVHTKKYKKELQDNINLLARMIDAKFEYTTCICCDRGFGAQTDGAHLHSVGSNHSLRFNLNNIHSASSFCNNHSNTHDSGYKNGLEKRYGKDYSNYVIEELPIIYPVIKLTAHEIYEKLTLVRKLIKTFDTFKFENSIQARMQFNKLINIYN